MKLEGEWSPLSAAAEGYRVTRSRCDLRAQWLGGPNSNLRCSMQHVHAEHRAQYKANGSTYLGT